MKIFIMCVYIFLLYSIFSNAHYHFHEENSISIKEHNVPSLCFPKSKQRYVIKQNYDLNGSTITIPENCIIDFDEGSLNNGYLILRNNIIINNGSFHDVIIYSSSNNIEFNNCDFEGGAINNSGTSYGKALLSFKGSSNVSVSNCKFHDGRLGLYCVDGKEFNVVNTVFKNMSYWPNYFSSVKGLIFDGCYSSHNGEDGIKLTGEIGDVIISNNESCYNGQDGVDFAGHSCYNVSIVNNIFHNNKLNGITFKTLDKNLYHLERWGLVDTELKWLNINISNNYIYNNKYTSIVSYHYYARNIGNRFKNFLISNNTIYSNIESITGMHISANTSVFHGVIITNNYIIGNFTYGVTFSNASHFLFKNNNVFVNGTGLRIDKQNYNGEPMNNDIVCNTIYAYHGNALHLYAETVNTNVKHNNLNSYTNNAIKDLGDNKIEHNDSLNLKIKWLDSKCK